MRSSKHKRGVLLYEAMMALALAMALSVGVAQILTVVANQRRLARQRAAAVLEAGNLMEQIAARPWEQAAPGQSPVSLSRVCRQWLPGAELKVEITGEEPDARRIRIEITWHDPSGQPAAPVCLAGWKFPAKEDGR
ncbi:MAG: hypothetical protein ACOX1P_06965 [Thermoguttaceae bacterium]|jgi:Tfp pilus assembly protein PilV